MARITALSTLLLLASACARGPVVSTHEASTAYEQAAELLHPAPTDPRADGDEEDDEERREERRRWVEEMHRSAPGDDWRALERANQTAERERRNLVATGALRSLSLGGLWSEVGSSNQAGHTRAAALGPSRGGVRSLYVGSANGGLWRGPEDGSDWEPISDALFGGVDDVVVLAPDDLTNDDIVVLRRGTEVLRSDDGGTTWTQPSGLDGIVEIRRLVRGYGPLETIYVFARANVSGNDRAALFASEDDGLTFTRRWTAAADWSGDVFVPRTGAQAGTHVYITHRGRVRGSTDGGYTFSLLSVVDTSATEGRIVGSEAGAPTLYVALRVGGTWKLYRSDDGGATTAYVRDFDEFWGDGRSFAAFASDPNALVFGGVNAYRSGDGGVTTQQINTWGEYYGAPATKLHADVRGINVLVDPDAAAVTDLCYFNTDGGTYLSTDAGASVQNLSLEGLGVGQFYSTYTSSLDPRRIVGGTQDQGYQRGYRVTSFEPGPSTPFDQLISGDYGHLGSGDGTHAYVYCTYPGFILVQVGETNPALRFVDFPAGSNQLWLPPVVPDPTDRRVFYFLADRLWRYTPQAGNWTPTQHSSFDFGAGAGSYLSALAFAPSDPTRVLAVNNAGRIFHSSDGGVQWTESTNSGPGSHYFYGNGLLIDPADPDHAFVCGSGYSSPGVRETTDGGVTWTDASSGLPPTLVYDIAWGPNGSADVYAATEAGAWRRDSATGQWSNLMGTAAPATTYWSVETVDASARVRFGTYGRGIWDFAVLEPGEPFGERYCSPAQLNVTGLPGTVEVTGSPCVADLDLTLTARQLPPTQFGLALASTTMGQTPALGGGIGTLCLGGEIGRFNGQIQAADATGSIGVTVDLTAIPQPAGALAAQPGDTWHFQFWYRDVLLGFSTSNLTDAVAVTLK